MQRILNSPTKRLITAYLHAHPYTYDRLSGFAQRLSLNANDIAVEIEELVNAGVVLKMGQNAGVLYALNTRDGWQTALQQFFQHHTTEPKRIDALFASLR